MTFSLTRTANLLLAFGFFFAISCSSTNSMTEADLQQTVAAGDYDQALPAINRLLRDDPLNRDLLVLKAETLKHLAYGQNRPENRLNYYREMTNTVLEPGSREYLADFRESLLMEVWSREHEAGLRLLQQNGPEDPDVIAHFENAILVNPSQIVTYNSKAGMHYRNGDIQKAVETLQSAGNRFGFDELPLDMQEKLAFLLLEEGQIQASIDVYSRLLENNPDRNETRYGLANAYILDGQHEASIRLLQSLLDEDPDNLAYHEALATELYFHIQNSFHELSTSAADDEEVAARYDTLMEELEAAEGHYQYIQENHPNPDEITFITAAFYKNTAGHLMNFAESRGGTLSDHLHEQARELLIRSIPVWESVIERNPENPEVWRSIYQIYSQLSMEAEAEEAHRRANL